MDYRDYKKPGFLLREVTAQKIQKVKITHEEEKVSPSARKIQLIPPARVRIGQETRLRLQSDEINE